MMADLQEACEESPVARSFEQLLAAAFRPGGMEREAAGRTILSEFMLLSPRLGSIGWSLMRAAATEATVGGDDEEAGRMGRAFGTILTRARDEAEQRMAALSRARDEARRSAGGQAAGAPGWKDATLETLVVISGSLHVFAHKARKYDREKRRGEAAPAFWGAFVAAMEEGAAWTPLHSLSEAQQRAGARFHAMPWVLQRTPTAGVASSAGCARLHEGPSSEASGEQAEAEQERLRAEEELRAKKRQRREERRAAHARWWRAVWREAETARARVHRIAQLVSGGRGRARYPEGLVVDQSTLLVELLHRQLEAQPLSARCWGSQHALAVRRSSSSW